MNYCNNIPISVERRAMARLYFNPDFLFLGWVQVGCTYSINGDGYSREDGVGGLPDLARWVNQNRDNNWGAFRQLSLEPGGNTAHRIRFPIGRKVGFQWFARFHLNSILQTRGIEFRSSIPQTVGSTFLLEPPVAVGGSLRRCE